MTTRHLQKTEWKSYCDRVAKGLMGKRAQIEVAGLTLGDQLATKWVPLIGITYDPKSDIFAVAVENLDHIIQRPHDLYVDEAAIGLSSIEIIEEGGRQHIVRLLEPLMLSPPGK
jgi:hypothetical protein